MPITTSLSSDIGLVRLELGDDEEVAGKGVKPDGTNITDAQIQVWLAREGHVMLAAAAGCEALARWWSKATDYVLPTREESLSNISKQWAQRGAALRRQYSGGLRIRRLARPENVDLGEYSTG